jgi:hypothetical protein
MSRFELSRRECAATLKVEVPRIRRISLVAIQRWFVTIVVLQKVWAWQKSSGRNCWMSLFAFDLRVGCQAQLKRRYRRHRIRTRGTTRFEAIATIRYPECFRGVSDTKFRFSSRAEAYFAEIPANRLPGSFSVSNQHSEVRSAACLRRYF